MVKRSRGSCSCFMRKTLKRLLTLGRVRQGEDMFEVWRSRKKGIDPVQSLARSPSMRSIRHLLKLISDRLEGEKCCFGEWLVTFWNLLPQRYQLIPKGVRQNHRQGLALYGFLYTLWLLFLTCVPKIYFLSAVSPLSSHIAHFHWNTYSDDF